MNSKKQGIIRRIAAFFLFSCVMAEPVFSQTRVWTGAGADELASNPDNWDAGVPESTHHIVLETTSSNMTWDAGVNGLPDTVASWTQKIDYHGTVTVATVYGDTGFTEFTITGDCVISNGVWTHIANTGNHNEHDRLCVAIGGDLFIGPDGLIDATGKGYANSRGPGQGRTWRQLWRQRHRTVFHCRSMLWFCYRADKPRQWRQQ